jgi:hypothetical protein
VNQNRFRNYQGQDILFSEERLTHILSTHPEMDNQIDRVHETLADPDQVVRSKTDALVELYYKHYQSTPVTTKYLCVVVKNSNVTLFIITAYFTDGIKKGEQIWIKK